MIGSNTLTLNAATMQAALQHYFETVLFADGRAPTVKGICTTGGYEKAFVVTVAEPEPKPAVEIR